MCSPNQLRCPSSRALGALAYGAARDVAPERERDALRRVSARILGLPGFSGKLDLPSSPYTRNANSDAAIQSEERRVSKLLHRRQVSVRGVAERSTVPTLLPLLPPGRNTSLAVSLYRTEITSRSADIGQLRAEKRQLALEGKRLKALVALERTHASFARLDLSRARTSEDVRVWRAAEMTWPSLEAPAQRADIRQSFPSPHGGISSALLLHAGAGRVGDGGTLTLRASQSGRLGSPDAELPALGIGFSGRSPSEGELGVFLEAPGEGADRASSPWPEYSEHDSDTEGEMDDGDDGPAAVSHRAAAASLDDDAAWRTRELMAGGSSVDRAVSANLSKFIS
ncbi:hypothetical protein T492DRAFT_924930 [Pavlovales sp. CCMP2436]|nr:hypothetical protein T492DRAFT_924930 [Pavlovales sp. CCMP2436]|mmetsp:Transcript_16507/g.39268  ORF Transcript_16507/g.39268 Transcript_16507/m.39268 type:complete len:340 (-) Transcript_16507:72-1091(-)